MQKGGQKKVHKYLSRYFKNGKWFYRYKVTGEGYKEDYAKNKLKSEEAGELAKQTTGENKNSYAKEASYYGRKAAEAEAGYKNSAKSKTDAAIARGQAKIDAVLHPKEKVTVSSNLMKTGEKKTVKKKK